MRGARAGGDASKLRCRWGASRVRTPFCSQSVHACLYIKWPMADVVAKGGIGSLRAPCGASGT
eukprot:683216-Prymnesium_polylepis.1